MESEIQTSNTPQSMKIAYSTLAAIALALVWLIWQAVVASQRIGELNDRHRLIQRLHGTISQLDDALTVSARTSVSAKVRSRPVHEREFEPALKLALHDAEALVPDVAVANAIEQVNVANASLSRFEDDALDDAEQGRQDEAKAMLLSDKYVLLKRVYADRTTELDVLLREALNVAVIQERGKAKLAAMIVLIVLPLLCLFAILAAKTVHSRSSSRISRDEREPSLQAAGPREDVPKQSVELLRQATLLLQTTEQLRASEDRFRGTFESPSVGMALVTPEGRWLEINQALCDIVVYTEAELRAMSYQTITHPDDLPKDLEFTRRLLAGEQRNFLWEKRYLHKSGRVVEIQLSVSLIRDASGQPLTFLAVIQDFTARNEAEREHDRFFSHSQTPMCVYGYDGLFKDFNPALQATFGYTREELLPVPFFDLVHPDDRKRTEEESRQTIAGVTCRRGEIRCRCKDGSYKWLSWDVVPCEVRQAFYAIGHDVTDRHLAEEALSESKEHITMLMNSTAEGIFGIDQQGNCTFANAACLRLFGFEHAVDLLGKNMHEQTHHSYADGTSMPKDACRILRALHEGLEAHVTDDVLWKRDGTSFPAEFWAYPIRKNGQIIGCAVSFLDITQRNKLREELDRFFIHTPNPIVIAGFDGYVKRVNPAVIAIGRLV